MKTVISTILLMALISPYAHAQKVSADNFAEELIGVVKDNEIVLKKYLSLHYDASIFLNYLMTMGNILNLTGKVRVSIKSNAESVSIKNLKVTFPFNADFLVTIKSDTKYEYLYTVIKRAEDGIWEVSKAAKRRKGSNKQVNLPLPEHSLELEANRHLIEKSTK